MTKHHTNLWPSFLSSLLQRKLQTGWEYPGASWRKAHVQGVTATVGWGSVALVPPDAAVLSQWRVRETREPSVCRGWGCGAPGVPSLGCGHYIAGDSKGPHLGRHAQAQPAQHPDREQHCGVWTVPDGAGPGTAVRALPAPPPLPPLMEILDILSVPRISPAFPVSPGLCRRGWPRAGGGWP